MQRIDEEAIKAAADQLAAEAFIAGSRQFILRCASKHSHRYITDSDDEWAVAMIAFSEALRLYDAEKGSFLAFAELVIRRRLTDFMRGEARHARQTNVDPAAFEGNIDEAAGDAGLQQAVLLQTIKEEDDSLPLEIEAVNSILARYGISFFDLTACSPQTQKTRKSCAAAVRHLIAVEERMAEMRRTGTLPIKAICQGAGVEKKVLERHRKYIIAAAEIVSGDFPHLAEYLSYVKKVEE